MNNSQITELFNELLILSTSTIWRHDHRQVMFLALTIQGKRVFLEPISGSIHTHSKIANKFIEDKLGRPADYIRKSGTGKVHEWSLK